MASLADAELSIEKAQPATSRDKVHEPAALLLTTKLQPPSAAKAAKACTMVAGRGWVDVSFSSSHRVGSRSMRCLLEVIPRCVVAGGHSPRDIRLSLSVRRAHLRKFTRSVRRMYLLWFNASRVLHRTWTGT